MNALPANATRPTRPWLCRRTKSRMENFARCNRLGVTSVAIMLREQSSTNTTSSPSQALAVPTLPHCGRASARPANANAASSSAFLNRRRAGLCDAVSSRAKCGDAIRASCVAARVRGVPVQQRQQNRRDRRQPQPARFGEMESRKHL